jgi:hypothetical protein
MTMACDARSRITAGGRTVKALLATLATLVALLAACGSTTAQSPSPAPSPSMTLAETICAPPADADCRTGIDEFLAQFDSGTLIVVCGFGDGVSVTIESTSGKEGDAEAECAEVMALQDRHAPSRVIRTVRLP